MGLFKRKTDYSYYSSYNSRRKLKIGRAVIAGIAGVVLVAAVIVYLNFNRIQFLWKGYSWSTTSEILSMFDSGEEAEILEHDKMDHILKWIDCSNKVELYDDYERYYAIAKKAKNDLQYEEIVEFIDEVFTGHLKLLSQYGYSNSVIWQLLEDGASKSDLTFLLENKLENEVTEPFRQVKGYTIKNMLNYIAKYNEVKDYNYAVNIVNYPFIISSNGKPGNYEIKNPDELLTLVKQGFYLSADYEPDDLVEPEEEYVAPDCGNRMLRKDAYEAMVKMIKAAEKEDLHLLLNSGYRSYAEQTKIYNETEAKYGGAYAAEYVAKPGASEHQTGLGLDMTSQSVVDGERLVFSDTAEYKWVLANCQKYGFVIRFEEGTDNITGISHEPWHLRYVGEDVARDMTEHGWTFEEYCLYNSVIPELKKE